MNEPIIVALSGRKGSGKNTVAKHLIEYYLSNRVLSPDQWFEGVREKLVYECSFADNLKEFCINTLGLSREACYGTEEEKNAPTHYRWENASPFFAWKFGTREVAHYHHGEVKVVRNAKESTSEELRKVFYSSAFDQVNNEVRVMKGQRTGFMSGRDIMQLLGTELIRETFGNVWAAATIRSIKRSGAEFAVITDNRFPNEIAAVLGEPKGYIIRLTRSPYGYGDKHPSEASLDDYDWNQERCYVVQNDEMSLKAQDQAVEEIMKVILSHNSNKID